MVRGITQFKCTECGHIFTGLDCEWCCTCFTAPVKCPKCGSWHTAPSFFGFTNPIYSRIYKSIWESIDKNPTND